MDEQEGLTKGGVIIALSASEAYGIYRYLQDDGTREGSTQYEVIVAGKISLKEIVRDCFSTEAISPVMMQSCAMMYYSIVIGL